MYFITEINVSNIHYYCNNLSYKDCNVFVMIKEAEVLRYCTVLLNPILISSILNTVLLK